MVLVLWHANIYVDIKQMIKQDEGQGASTLYMPLENQVGCVGSLLLVEPLLVCSTSV